MIKQLQKKFVVSAMLAISVLLIVVLGGINIFNGISAKRQTDNLLSTLAQVENSAITLMLPEVKDSWNFFSSVVTQDDTLGAIYFVVRADNYGNVWSVDTTHISSVNMEEAIYYTKQIYNKSDNIGSIGRFKYMMIPTVGNLGKTYIFLDITKQVSNVWQVLFLSVGVGVLCWFAMLLLVVLLSKKAIRPIASNIEKQKQFVTDAGHEIKTPLAIIMANTDAMELCYGENKYSKNIRNQIFRLKDLTQDLLTLAKMEENSEKVKEWFSMTDLVEETLDQFVENIVKKNVVLQKNVQMNLNIKSDRGQIQRLLSILMDNANQYVSENGTIEVALQQSNKMLVFVISNTADNLRQLQLDKIFDRFYRGDDARTQKSGGSGIGLSSALAIVQAQKGQITAQTQDYEKIIFTIKLPIE